MDTDRHARERERLNQALNGDLEKVTSELKEVLKKANIDAMPEFALDVCVHTIEELYLERLNLPVL